jgi:hypothetical protein
MSPRIGLCHILGRSEAVEIENSESAGSIPVDYVT